MVFPALVLGLGHKRCAAKLGGPNYQRVLQQAPLLKVLQKSGNRTVYITRQTTMVGHILVRIPIAT